MKKIIKLSVLALFVAFTFTGCEDLDVTNENNPDSTAALADDSDITRLMNTASTDVMFRMIGFSGIFYNLMADQTSTTNAFRGFWSYADQPRLQINNSPTNANNGFSVGSDWSGFNNYIYTSNLIIKIVEFDGTKIIIEGKDVTNQLLAQAYFVKGLSQGYLSIIYDKGYIVNPDTDPATLEFSDYKTMNEEALKNLDNSMSIANSVSDFELFIYEGYTIDKATFLKVANSFAAKILISSARTKAEAATTDYNKVLAYANSGITSDFSPPTNGGYQFYNNMQDWSTFTLSDGAGYLPTDIKVIHMLDNSIPKDYPTDSNIILSDANSADPRQSYFGYTTAFGFLRESRGRHLFTNWKNNRYFTNNDRGSVAGLSTDIFHTEELDYIKAEATLMTSGPAAAAAMLNTSARFTKGNITTAGTAADVEYALHYEYAVELDLGASIGTTWFFMRRHDLLQVGTPLSYPVPGTELEITGDALYSFGGADNGAQDGTADGSNSWKN